MEFKYINDRTKTPQSKSCIFTRRSSCDTHFKFLPSDISTPPSKFSRIVNPFEPRLIDRLHLPTSSPSVFATISTPKTDEHFKWTIDDISSLKPADIDEGTISQHIFEDDPQVESMVQQKIDEFFSEKVIVPSPMVDIVRVPLVADNPKNLLKITEMKEYCEGSTQTVLSLPPVLPPHIEEILKPYYLPTEDKTKTDMTDMKDTSLFQNLFNFDKDTGCCTEQESVHSDLHLSRKEFSPVASPILMDRRHSLPFEMTDLQDCSLSPIVTRKSSPRTSRSACRLNFSSKMSVDASLIVPDLCNESNESSLLFESPQRFQPQVEELNESPVNWDIEYQQVSFTSPTSSQDSCKMHMSNSNTPHSKLFTSQRKRLSDSFKIENEDYNKEDDFHITSNNIKQGRKLFRNNVTDAGYHTETINFYDESDLGMHMFASTPSKTKKDFRVRK